MIRLLVIISVFVLGCGLSRTPDELNSVDLIKWYKEFKHEFVHEKTIDEYTFKVEFIPQSVFLLSEFQSIGLENKKDVISRDSQLSDYLVCRITFSKSNPLSSFLSAEDYSPEEYSSRLSYFISHIQKDIYLIDEVDTLKSQIYHFENTYGLERSNKADRKSVV